MKRLFIVAAAAVTLIASAAMAAGQYDKGASDSEIKIGQTSAYSGPASGISVISKVEAAYIDMINKRGGIHGRKIKLLSEDDNYNPVKTVEMTRRLVEQDGVLFMWGSIGTPTNFAVKEYLNAKKIPQLLVSSEGLWSDPEKYPMATAFSASAYSAGKVLGRHIAQSRPGTTVAVLYQGDDFGKFHVQGFKDGLNGAAKIVIEQTYQITDPSIGSTIDTLAASNAEVFLDITQGKFTAQTLRRLSAIAWRPYHLLTFGGSQVVPGLDDQARGVARGMVSTIFYKNPIDPTWSSDQGMKNYLQFMTANAPGINMNDLLAAYGYMSAQVLEYVLDKAGDNLTHANLAKVATSIDNLRLDLMPEEMAVQTSPRDYTPFKALLLQIFDGEKWTASSKPISTN